MGCNSPQLPWQVYFAQAVDGVVKIGTTARNPLGRIRAQSGPHGKLTLLHTIPGAHEIENGFHRLLRADRAGQRPHYDREWFNPTPRVVGVVDYLRTDCAARPPELDEYTARIAREFVVGNERGKRRLMLIDRATQRQSAAAEQLAQALEFGRVTPREVAIAADTGADCVMHWARGYNRPGIFAVMVMERLLGIAPLNWLSAREHVSLSEVEGV